VTATPRPRAASVFGLLNLVFGGIGFLGALGGPQDMGTSATPVVGELLSTEAMRQWLDVSQGLALAISALTLLLGIALLQMVWWARVGQVWFAATAIAVGLVTSYVSWTRIEAAAAQVRRVQPTEGGQGPDEAPSHGEVREGDGEPARGASRLKAIDAFLLTFRVSAVLGTLLNILYYGTIIHFMTRPNVRAAFAAERAAA